MRIPECEKFLHVESGLLGFGIRNTAEVLRIPDNNWNPESKFHLKLIRNPRARNPELKTILDYLTWRDRIIGRRGEPAPYKLSSVSMVLNTKCKSPIFWSAVWHRNSLSLQLSPPTPLLSCIIDSKAILLKNLILNIWNLASSQILSLGAAILNQSNLINHLN